MINPPPIYHLPTTKPIPGETDRGNFAIPGEVYLFFILFQGLRDKLDK